MSELAQMGEGVGDENLAPNNMEALATLVGGAAALFYWAEKDANPAVQTYWDAVHYVATSLSVGYANIFPVTQLGKTIGAVIMMVGPAMSARALDPPPAAAPAPSTDPALLTKLDEILTELRKLTPATP
jgi:voltage-gated potassium channel